MSDHDTWNMFAAAALQGMCAYSGMATDSTHEVRAFNAAMHADALLAESKKRETPAPTPPQPDDDGWIKWEGGECPVPHGTLVDIKTRDGELFRDTHGIWVGWSHSFGTADIVAYRIVSEAGVTK